MPKKSRLSPAKPVVVTAITLHPMAKAGLNDLHAKLMKAQHDWNTAANAIMAAHGLDPSLAHHLDLDQGVITPAKQD